MEDRITHAVIKHKSIRAIAEFNYRGYLITMDGMFDPIKVIVSKGNFSEGDFLHVEAAINFINKRSI